MGEDLLDHHRIFDAGDDLDLACASLAGFNVDVEYALQSARPRHCGAYILAISKRPKRALSVDIGCGGDRPLWSAGDIRRLSDKVETKMRRL